VVKVGEDYFEVRLDERAEGDVANKRLLEILAEHFKVPKGALRWLFGVAIARELTICFSPSAKATDPCASARLRWLIIGNSTDFIIFICLLSSLFVGLQLTMVFPNKDAASHSRVACRQFRALSSSDCSSLEQSWNSSLSSSTSKQRDDLRSSDHACPEYDDPMGRDG